MEKLQKDRASAARVAEAEAAMKSGDGEAAYAKAKEILSENPAQKNAKAIVRKVEEKNANETVAEASPGVADDQRCTDRADAEQAKQHPVIDFGTMQPPAYHRWHQRLIAGETETHGQSPRQHPANGAVTRAKAQPISN